MKDSWHEVLHVRDIVTKKFIISVVDVRVVVISIVERCDQRLKCVGGNAVGLHVSGGRLKLIEIIVLVDIRIVTSLVVVVQRGRDLITNSKFSVGLVQIDGPV